MEKSIKSSAINYGVYLAIILILFTVIGYAFKLDLLVNYWFMLLILPVTIIAFGVVSTAKAKSMLGGFMSFKQAFTAYFIPVALAVSASTLFSILLFNFIDPEAAEQIKQILIDKTQSFMEGVGATQTQIEESIRPIREQDTFAFTTQLRSLAQSLVFFIVIGLIVALIMKKKDPNEA